MALQHMSRVISTIMAAAYDAFVALDLFPESVLAARKDQTHDGVRARALSRTAGEIAEDEVDKVSLCDQLQGGMVRKNRYLLVSCA